MRMGQKEHVRVVLAIRKMILSGSTQPKNQPRKDFEAKTRWETPRINLEENCNDLINVLFILVFSNAY